MVIVSILSLGNLDKFPASIDSIAIPDHGVIGFILALACLFLGVSKFLEAISKFTTNTNNTVISEKENT
jgi:hypothetical protein